MSIDWIPTRKITPKEQGNRGIIPSNKVPIGFVEYESCLERDFYLELNHAPDVIKFQHQPKTLGYKDKKGKNRKYTPDVYVEYIDGINGLYEIKYEEELVKRSKINSEKWNVAEDWAKQRGIEFAILTEKQIRTARRENIWLTLGASKCSSNDKYMNKLNALISPEGNEYNILCNILAEELGIEIGKSAQIICFAIYHGFVFLDTFSTKLISKDTIIRKRTRNKKSPFKPLRMDLGLENDIKYHLDKNNTEISKEFSLKDLKSESSVGKYEEVVKKREKIVKLWMRQPSRKRSNQWRIDFSNKYGIPERTIYRWVNSYLKDGREGLIPKHNKKGRQKIFNNNILNLIEKARRYYLKTSVTLFQAYEYLKKKCNQKQIEVPSESTFRGYIYKNTTASELGKKRGRKYYKSNFTPSLNSFQGAYIPMQVIQMDNTDFDVFPVDSESRSQIRTPYMTAAIDCFTCMMTGFSLSYFPSSAQSVLEVLVQSILSKNNYTKIYNTQFDWTIQGFPVIIIVDNGLDYKSGAVKEFCKKYDIIIEYVPLRTPRYKAYIEQWFNTLRNALKRENVPATRPPLKYRLENPDLKPENDAVLTLQNLEIWLHKWIIDDYHFSNSYDDHVKAPYLRWKDAQNGHTDIILPSPREPPIDNQEIDIMHLSTLDKIPRTLTRDGIVWEYLKYNTKELSEIYAVKGKSIVKLLLDRRDVRNAWIINPITENLLKIRLATGWAKALLEGHSNMPVNKSAWIREVRRVKSIIRSKLTPYKYKKEISRLQREKLLKKSKKETKLIRREQEKAREVLRKPLKLNSIEYNTKKEEIIDDQIIESDDYHPTIIFDELNDKEELDDYKPNILPVSFWNKSINDGGDDND